ncbi:MAG: type IIL restriction-modification enzyme MmeI, partial [Lentisphaeria bacterium]
MDTVESFIDRWRTAAASERANYQLFLSELCDLLGVPRPDPATGDSARDNYVFDKPLARPNPDGSTTPGFIDLYKAGCFVLEAKQGAAADGSTERAGHGRRGTRGWDTALERAYNQAANYIKDLPAAPGRPPFLIVCDVGHVIELYSEFSRTGGAYVRFPDPQHHRIFLDDLRQPEIRARLKAVWTAPLDLDPARHAAAVTRAVAARLAELARALEAAGHPATVAAPFIQRCLFTLFAEDVGLLPKGGFQDILKDCLEHPEGFPAMAGQLWREMATGTAFSTILKCLVPYFNGGLFDDTTALPLAKPQIALLHDAARVDWAAVEPAIFGTLLERALDPRERHKLGAHYTPRSYVERLVQPTVIQPLREEWDAVRAAAAQLCAKDKEPAARAAVEKFHRRLCTIRVLDPAC